MTVYEDEIDLRPYVLSLIRQWRRIFVVAFIAAVAAMAITLLQTRKYPATATILLTRSRASLFLAEQFPTIREPIYDSTSRMNAILSIAQSDAIAFATLQSIGDMIPVEERELEEFKDRVEVTDQGDSILITALAKNPGLAAEIANTWASQAVLAINQAYSGEQPLAEIQSRLNTAKQEYESNQGALEAFLQENRITILENKLAEAKNLLSEAVNDRAWQVSYYYNRKQSMQDLKLQAEALKKQLQGGSNSTAGNIGNALAILNANARAFGIGQIASTRAFGITETSENTLSDYRGGFIFDLRMDDLSALDDSAAAYLEDLDLIIKQAEEEILKAENALQSLTRGVAVGEESDIVEAIGAQIQALETQLENQHARQRELATSRDLAWNAYQVLVQKETEIKNSAQTGDQVTLASLAVPPQKPAPRGTIRNTLVAGTLGLLVGVFWVFASMWWRSMEQPPKAETPLSMADQTIK